MAYTYPPSTATNITFGRVAMAVAGSSNVDLSFAPVGYVSPPGTAADFHFPGSAYTAPNGASASFGVAAAAGASGSGAAVTSVQAAGSGQFTAPLTAISGAGAATMSAQALGGGAHGVVAVGAITVTPDATGPAAHGVAGAGAPTASDAAAAGAGVVSSGYLASGAASPAGTSADGGAVHGVTGAGADTVFLAGAGSGGHGVSGAGDATAPAGVAGTAAHTPPASGVGATTTSVLAAGAGRVGVAGSSTVGATAAAAGVGHHAFSTLPGSTFTFESAAPYTPSADFDFSTLVPPPTEYQYPVGGVEFTFAGAQPYAGSPNFGFTAPGTAGAISARATGFRLQVGQPRYTVLAPAVAMPAPRFGQGRASYGVGISTAPAQLEGGALGLQAPQLGRPAAYSRGESVASGIAANIGQPTVDVASTAAGIAAAVFGTPGHARGTHARPATTSWGRTVGGTGHPARSSPTVRAGRHSTHAQLVAGPATLGAVVDFGSPETATSHQALPTFQPIRFGQPTRALNPC